MIEVLPPGTYTSPNGITRSKDGRRRFVAHGAGIDRIDTATGARTRLRTPDTLNVGGIDGLAFHRNSLIARRSAPGRRCSRQSPLADGTPTEYGLGFQALEEEGRRLLLQPGGGPGLAGWLARTTGSWCRSCPT